MTTVWGHRYPIIRCPGPRCRVARWAGLTDFIIRKVVSLPIVERFRKRRQARLLNEYRSNHSAGRHGKLRCSLEFSDR